MAGLNKSRRVQRLRTRVMQGIVGCGRGRILGTRGNCLETRGWGWGWGARCTCTEVGKRGACTTAHGMGWGKPTTS